MPGGLLQLVAYGAQNFYLNGNPSLSFFKKVFKTHTNFSSESIRINFNRSTLNFDTSTTLISKIDRNADLIQEIYFVMKLPSIKKLKVNDEFQKFNFVKNLGECMIDHCYVNIGGNIIDKQYGEWMHVWNELSIQASKRYGYDKLIGNIPELYSPDDNHFLKEKSIQIFERKIYIPLKFWFNKNPGLALPLISMQYHQVELVIEIRPIKDIFTINDLKPSFSDFERYFAGNMEANALVTDLYLETNYIFLDTDERTYFALNSIDYLIEQVSKIDEKGIPKNYVVNLPLHNPVKELIWVLNRNDRSDYNKWFDFVDWEYEHIVETQSRQSYQTDVHQHVQIFHETERHGEILKNAKIMFNGLDRIETKDNYYFNLIQPYQHHTFIPKEGIYVYSFSLFPESFQPSGNCNMSKLNKIQMNIETIEPLYSNYKYDSTLYAVNYNFLRITSGLAGLAYSC